MICKILSFLLLLYYRDQILTPTSMGQFVQLVSQSFKGDKHVVCRSLIFNRRKIILGHRHRNHWKKMGPFKYIPEVPVVRCTHGFEAFKIGKLHFEEITR